MKLFPVLALVSFLALSVSCGQTVDEHTFKTYTLAVDRGTTESNTSFRNLVNEFNNMAGLEALQFTENKADANSLITLVPDLQSKEGKVGWGQWITETREQNTVKGISVKKDRTIEYSMRLDLDQDYVSSRMKAKIGSSKHYELQKLFFHETGHGLQMAHNKKQSHVMYYEISGKKDFVGFFEEVAAFFK
jgi:hypothetical protein